MLRTRDPGGGEATVPRRREDLLLGRPRIAEEVLDHACAESRRGALWISVTI
jgi:hypothetical protein